MDNFEFADMDKIQLEISDSEENRKRKILIYRRTSWIRSGWFPHIKEFMCQRVSKLETIDNVAGSSNFGKFIKLFENDDSGWINEINRKLEE